MQKYFYNLLEIEKKNIIMISINSYFPMYEELRFHIDNFIILTENIISLIFQSKFTLVLSYPEIYTKAFVRRPLYEHTILRKLLRHFCTQTVNRVGL